jgi:hypothetical protein
MQKLEGAVMKETTPLPPMAPGLREVPFCLYLAHLGEYGVPLGESVGTGRRSQIKCEIAFAEVRLCGKWVVCGAMHPSALIFFGSLLVILV